MEIIFKKHFVRCLLFCVLIVAPHASYSQVNTSSEVLLTPGDAVRILVYEGNVIPNSNRFIAQFHNQEFIIDGRGEIRLGSLGKLKISGHTADEIAKMLNEKFLAYAKEPNVVVIPLIRLILRGDFGQPGMYRFSLDQSFWNIIEEVGGVGNSLSLENMYILRNGEILYKNFTDAFYKAQSLAELQLQAGDEIVIPNVNRISFYSIMRYVQFASSLIVLYFTLTRQNKY